MVDRLIILGAVGLALSGIVLALRGFIADVSGQNAGLTWAVVAVVGSLLLSQLYRHRRARGSPSDQGGPSGVA